MEYKVGLGYDIHPLIEGRKLILGGIEIPYSRGLLGHSDGDALIHAICDALLGALHKGDLGEHFPDYEPQYQGIQSSYLLSKVKEWVKEENFEITYIDTVIIAQEPHLGPFKLQIQKKISEILEISLDRINIKAKTSEGLTEIGRKEAIACWAVALIKERSG
ncbi:MAG: 2-C-methyl-D-erythritol 2,4-cyclodiphosphate synthase [Candidatus Omnitrophica bacterium]|nr:2-C-methyl-D-erythritol 2,4-cyclodiphosphate synthase [Candidatus Omnitrophota bacterium]MCM8799255.1 2-C-methyl-D-erythritol 2,4-cyclodiphosphate synthase [Candidatus Omnitrophota bacterium]